MTAGHIAQGLGRSKVAINYLASENLIKLFGCNPMPELEFVRSSENKYSTGGVDFTEPAASQSYRDEMFSAFPETFEQAQVRGVAMYEHLNKKVADANYSRKRICYIIISHGMFVDLSANLLGLVKTEVLPTTLFSGLSSDQRQKAIEHVSAAPYTHAEFCSMSAFMVDDSEAIEPVFRRYNG